MADKDESKFAKIFFVNINKTILILKKHYSLFKKITEMDFDQKNIVYEIEGPSIFWEKVFSSAELVGLLYGFGEKNVLFFWETG